MKRIGMWIATNLAIMAMLGIFLNIVLPLLGIELGQTGSLLVICLVFGMGGSLISLMLSKRMALWGTKAQIIINPRNQTERWLVDTVASLAKQSGIGTPDVAIYPAADINAFATGASRNKALVAVSSGLLQQMSRDEAEAVLAHEVAHVANGDMITLTLIQGVLNTFVMFMARIVANIIANSMRSNGNQGIGFMAYYGIVFVLEIVFGLLASIVVMWFSRKREYAADAGAAKLVGPHKMVMALQRLKQSYPSELKGELVAFGINGKPSELFASHPSLDDRIHALQNHRG